MTKTSRSPILDRETTARPKGRAPVARQWLTTPPGPLMNDLPLTKREDALIFAMIALPIFAVMVLTMTLVVVLGTR